MKNFPLTYAVENKTDSFDDIFPDIEMSLLLLFAHKIQSNAFATVYWLAINSNSQEI